MGRAARQKQQRREAAIRSTALPAAAPCPACGELLDAATGVTFDSRTGPTPTPGAITLCAYCATALAFTDAMTLRLATADDLAQLSAEARAWLERIAGSLRM